MLFDSSIHQASAQRRPDHGERNGKLPPIAATRARAPLPLQAQAWLREELHCDAVSRNPELLAWVLRSGLLALPPATVQGSIKTGREPSNHPVSTASSGRSRPILRRVVETSVSPPPSLASTA